MIDLPIDRGLRPFNGLCAAATFHHLQSSSDGRQRLPKLVREDGDKFIRAAVEIMQLPFGFQTG